jgi:hypothetical protein
MPPPPVADDGDNAAATGDQDGRRKNTKQRGRYTGKKCGHCKYGGWSCDGMSCFNELFKLVQEDRACPDAEAMEKELLSYCRSQAGVVNRGATQGEPGDNAAVVSARMDASFVEAAWDIDD